MKKRRLKARTLRGAKTSVTNGLLKKWAKY